MNKSLHRIVALLLTVCLVLDPVSGFAFQVTGSTSFRPTRNSKPETRNAVFIDQALVLALPNFVFYPLSSAKAWMDQTAGGALRIPTGMAAPTAWFVDRTLGRFWRWGSPDPLPDWLTLFVCGLYETAGILWGLPHLAGWLHLAPQAAPILTNPWFQGAFFSFLHLFGDLKAWRSPHVGMFDLVSLDFSGPGGRLLKAVALAWIFGLGVLFQWYLPQHLQAAFWIFPPTSTAALIHCLAYNDFLTPILSMVGFTLPVAMAGVPGEPDALTVPPEGLPPMGDLQDEVKRADQYAREINLLVTVCGMDLKKAGGMETYIQNLHRALIANGDLTIHVFYPGSGSLQLFTEPGSNGRIIYHELARDPRTRWIFQTFQMGWLFLRMAGGLLREERRSGRRATAIHIHGAFGQGLILASSLLSLRHGIPRVVTVHGEALIRGLTTHLTEKYAVIFLLLGAWVTAVTPELLRSYPGKHSVIGTGIDTRRWQRRVPDQDHNDAFKDSYGLKKNIPILFYPARIERYKNQMALIDLAVRLRARGLRFQFVVMGEHQDAAYTAALIQRIRELGLSDLFVVLPPASSEIVYQMLEVTYAIVMPSLSEGRSMAILEAASMNVPTIAFDVGGMSHIIRDWVTGFLVPVSMRALEQKTAELLENPALRDQMTEAARQFVEEDHSIERLVARQFDFYRQANAGLWSLIRHAALTVIASLFGLVVFGSGVFLSLVRRALTGRLSRNNAVLLRENGGSA